MLSLESETATFRNRLSAAAAHLEASPLQGALAATSRPNLLSLAMGLPDPLLLPNEALAGAALRVLTSGGSTLQYRTPCEPLKEFICQMMAQRGVYCTPDSILLTQGAQQALQLLSAMFVNVGSAVIEEEFTYPGFQNMIDLYRPHIITTRTDQTNGIDVGQLELLFASGGTPALIYLMPSAHNPLGVTLTLTQRRE